MPSEKVVEAICRDCNPDYCIFQEFLKYRGDENYECSGECRLGVYTCEVLKRLDDLGVKDRTVLQVNCVKSFKWIESEGEGRDVGWQKAWFDWIKAYGKRFADLFDKRGVRDPEVLFEECMHPGSRIRREAELVA